MAVFEYNAREGDVAARGTIVADSPRAARDLLRAKGLAVRSIRPSRSAAESQRKLRRRDQQELVAFIRELATLLSAGITLLEALRTLAQQHRRNLRTVIQHLCDHVASGVGLAEAMRPHCRWFDEYCISIVEVGQSTGSLDHALHRLAELKERSLEFRSRAVTAMTYPAIVCLTGMAVMIFLMTYVAPTLLGTLAQSGRPLPALTRGLKTVSDFLLSWWWTLPLAAVAIAAVVHVALRRPAVRFAWHGLLLRLPIVGDLARKEITSRIAVVMASLLRSGLRFVPAIQITRRTLDNLVFRRALEQYEAAITAGADVAGPLRASGVFSPMVVQMLAVGQEAGQVEDMLDQLARSYDHEVATTTQRFLASLEPLLILLLATGVGVIAMATLLPILEMSNVL